MAKAFFIANDLPRAIMAVRQDANGQPQPLDTAIPDGDTIGVHVAGSGAIRFLGIDTPEKQFEVPGSTGVPGGQNLNSPVWEAYLTDPFLPQLGSYPLDTPLVDHLRTRIGSGAGVNHRFHADSGKQALKALVESDMTALGQNLTTFGFFLAFSFEVFDAHGRFLAYINRNQPNGSTPSPRPPTYNERMLESGAALPYFIWPNIDPFRAKPLLDAVLAPRTANQVAQDTPALRQAREFTQHARANKIGVFDPANPLRFEAFEVRYLGERKVPNRAVIDLSRNDDVILRPQSYFRIPNPEDRLFIPPAFVPLFAARGWRLEGWF